MVWSGSDEGCWLGQVSGFNPWDLGLSRLYQLRITDTTVCVLFLLVILCRLLCPMVSIKQVLTEPHGPMCVFIRKEANGCYQSWRCRVWERLFSLGACSMVQEAHISDKGRDGVSLVCGDWSTEGLTTALSFLGLLELGTICGVECHL